MQYLINIDLLRNPLNWFSIAAMLALVAIISIAIKSHLDAGMSDDNATANFAKES